jgi:protein-export membrane protein SecD
MKTERKLLSLLPVLLLLNLSLACDWAGRRFGPKDEGGLYLVIAVKADVPQLDQSIQQTVAVIQKRCERLGVSCKLERQSGDKSNRIMLRISSPKDPERIKSVLLSEGLELRPVVSPPMPSPVQTYPTQAEAEAAVAESKGDVMPYLEKEGPRKFIIVEHTPLVTGQDILDARTDNRLGADDTYEITFQLSPAGAQRFGEWTGTHIHHYMAVVMNGQVRSTAYIQSQIFDRGQISGHFTKAEAEDGALVLMSGSLPAPIETLEEGVYKP